MEKRGIKKGVIVLPTVFVVIILLIGVIPLHVTADDPTQVYVSPVSKTISAGQTFTLAIACTPGQSIKAYELRILFNPTLLIANSVMKGNIFNGYTNFSNNGTINNTAGTIIDIYGLIVGAGSVSIPGSLVSITFTAKLTSGTSTIGLSMVGVTNDTAYVPITVTNGTVTLREYSLSVTIDGSGCSVTKGPDQATYSYGQVVTLTAVPGTGYVFSSWTGDRTGTQNPTTITMNGNKTVHAAFVLNGPYTLTLTTSGTGSGTIQASPSGPYYYGASVTIWANASTGSTFTGFTGGLTGTTTPQSLIMNGNKAVDAYFLDTAPPQISGITRITSDPLDTNPTYGWVNVSCTVTDNVAVFQVILRIHTPSGSWNNVSMMTRAAGTYYYRSTIAFSAVGNYSYSILAIDTSSNVISSSNVLFSMPANWDMNSDGRCVLLDLVLISNHYGETGAHGWIREDADNNGIIQVLDLVYISNHFSESWWV